MIRVFSILFFIVLSVFAKDTNELIVIKALEHLKEKKLLLNSEEYKELKIYEKNIGREFFDKKIITIIKEGLFDDSIDSEKFIITYKLNKKTNSFEISSFETLYKCARGENKDKFIKNLCP